MSDIEYWDNKAATFDDVPDHGLREPAIRQRWQALLYRLMPGGGTALDLGCGTGSLSVLMAQAGIKVTGIDVSPAMIHRARNKARQFGVAIDFLVQNAAHPQFAPESFDVVLGRHILWTVSRPIKNTLLEWARLLRPGGRLILIEGFWHTGVGLHRHEILGALPLSLKVLVNEDLTGDIELWGQPVTDERYVICVQRA